MRYLMVVLSMIFCYRFSVSIDLGEQFAFSKYETIIVKATDIRRGTTMVDNYLKEKYGEDVGWGLYCVENIEDPTKYKVLGE